MRPQPSTRARKRDVLWLAVLAAAAVPSVGAGPFSAVSGSEQLTAVSSSSHNGYVRTRLADGSYAPETYVFGNARERQPFFDNEGWTNDPTIEGASFSQIAHIIAVPLAEDRYIPSFDPASTKLLVMVSWGRTVGGQHFRDGLYRDEIDYQNAKLLGFDSESLLQAATDASTVFYGQSFRARMLENLHADVLSAIEVDRYFVVLQAFDFQSAWRHRGMKLLWETRFSLSERRHDFQRDLPAMAQDAALYFGKDTYGLVLKPIPEGTVRVGEPTPVEDRVDADEGGSFDPGSGAVGDWRRTSAGPPLIIHIDASGASTFGVQGQDFTVPARATTDSRVVTVKVPGWGIIIKGDVRGDRIKGTIFQYDQRNSVTLTRVTQPPGDGSR
jgi:hypothetical protein